MRPFRVLIALALAAGTAPLLAASAGPGELKLFRDRNFAGPAMALAEANSSFSVSPRSVRTGGAVWLLCERPFFGGRCQEVKEDSAKLTLHRAFSGTVRSARPVSMAAPAVPDEPKPPKPPKD